MINRTYNLTWNNVEIYHNIKILQRKQYQKQLTDIHYYNDGCTENRIIFSGISFSLS